MLRRSSGRRKREESSSAWSAVVHRSYSRQLGLGDFALCACAAAGVGRRGEEKKGGILEECVEVLWWERVEGEATAGLVDECWAV
jgi:hypothetical protein